MKLSRKNRACQTAIRKAIACGKSVSGLLAGALAIATTGCGCGCSRVPMGDYPNPNARELEVDNQCEKSSSDSKSTGDAAADVKTSTRPQKPEK